MTLRLKEELSKLTQILRLILCLQLALATPLAQAEEPLELLYTRAIGGDLTQFLSGLDIGSEFFHYQDGMVYQATLISKSILPDGTPYFKVSLSSPGQADLPYTDNSSGTVPMPEGNGSGTGPMPEGTVGNNQTGGFGSDLINAGIASGAAIGGILITEFSGLSKAQAEYDRNMGKLRGRINEHREAIQNLIGQISEDQLRAGVALTRTQEVLKQV
ncbi:MAG: hypothetical protein KDD68_20695, partial [Bdellovibrionales bacterium]|nr:hypothetical protein [Bdellovibrionales bacterium]